MFTDTGASHDLQSMARIHRSVTTFLIVIVVETDFARSDGQKRSVYIYRFLTAGTIDGRSDQRVEGQYLIVVH